MGGEMAFAFDCGGAALTGILHGAAADARTGVVIVVGGPQYRIGSHRQFLLLARAVAASGLPTLRFDCRGMGDSDGDFPGFEAIDDDIRAAVDALTARVPTIERVILWGLCDAASAILFYAHQDPRIAGAVLVNPWVRTEAGEAKTVLRHYYWRRLVAGDFWKKLLSGRVNPLAAGASLAGNVRTAVAKTEDGSEAALADRMADGLARFAGPVLLITCGNDLTAREFEDCAAASPRWRDLLAASRIARHRLPEADHTFSRQAWRESVVAATVDWLGALSPEQEPADA